MKKALFQRAIRALRLIEAWPTKEWNEKGVKKFAALELRELLKDKPIQDATLVEPEVQDWIMKVSKNHSPADCPYLHVHNCPGCGRSCSCYSDDKKKKKAPVQRERECPGATNE